MLTTKTMTTTTSPTLELSQTPMQQQQQQQHVNITILRPTEAQLRWAQFHHERVAVKVQEQVRRMYTIPRNINDVPNTIPSDFEGLSEEKDHDSDQNNHSDGTAKISKGRQVMLRVSQRHYEERRQRILTEGFWYDNNSNDKNEEEKKDDLEDDVLDSIFAETKKRRRTTAHRKKRRRSTLRLNTGNHDDDNDDDDDMDRIRRFEAAFYALLSSLAALEAKNYEQQTKPIATKKWTRPSGVSVHQTVDGREYSDLKWGIVAATPSTSLLLPRQSTELKDTDGENTTRATPAPTFDQAKATTITTTTTQFTTDMRIHLQGVARQYLRTSSENEKVADDDDDDDDVVSFVECFERHMTATGTNHHHGDTEDDIISPKPIASNDIASFVAKYEQQQQRGLEMVQIISPTTADLISRFENQQERDGFVQRLVSEIERAIARQDPSCYNLISADGKLHKPTFARLIQRYLVSLSTSASSSSMSKDLSLRSSFKNNYSTSELKSEETNSVTEEEEENVNDENQENDANNNRQLSKFVQIFMDQLEHEQCDDYDENNRNENDDDTIITGDGTLNRSVLEQVVSHCLDEARKNIVVVEDSRNVTSGDTLLVVASEERLQHPIVSNDNDDVITATPVRSTATTTTDVFDRILNVTAKMKNFRFGKDKTIPSVPTMEDDHVIQVDLATNPNSNNIVGSVSNKVSELFHSLHLKNTTDEAAYIAFREIQDQKRRSSIDPPTTSNHDGDESSQSSFRVLPRGIRNVVKSLRNVTTQHRYRPGNDSEYKLEMEVCDYVDENETTTGMFDDVESGAELTRDGVDGNCTLDQQQLLGLSAGVSGSMDTDGSTISGTDQHITDRVGLASIMLSPTLLTKRHQQAIRAVESFNWAQVKYLLSANPWLAEMADVNTNQYMLHKVAYYGSGQLGIDHITGEVISVRHEPAPDYINIDLVNLFPSSVHKLDHDGNLPLHMAAFSANLPMIHLLGNKFSSGASVRNENGMLPLHLALIACASPVAVTIASNVEPIDIVQALLSYFPGAVGVTDNEGNLPIHTAASVLRGTQGASIINFLLDEAEKQVSGPSFLRFRNSNNTPQMYDDSMETSTEISQSDSSVEGDECTNCLLVTNNLGYTSLLLAIYSHAGWEIIESLLRSHSDIFSLDSENNNALHLLVSEQYKDPAAALKVLSKRPDAATVRNDMGMLPIEVACMQMLPREVILALVLVDLPINLDTTDASLVKDGYGASWWYLVCECDDFYVGIVEDVVSFCSFPQVRSLCLLGNGSGDVLLTRATPKCKNVLDGALRIIGRFEFVDSSPIFSDAAIGVEAFNALDFGTKIDSLPEGRNVILKCFTSELTYLKETAILRGLKVSFSHFEEILTFTVGDTDSNRGPLPVDGRRRYFISVESPRLTLAAVVRGMLNNHGCQADKLVRQRYSGKVFSVLRLIAIALHRLHCQGFIHGNLSLENCAKFDEKWKLANLLGAKRIGDMLQYTTEMYAVPPEALQYATHRGSDGQTIFKAGLVAGPSVDMWAFGKVAYEALAGQAMIPRNNNNSNNNMLSVLLQWNDVNVLEVQRELERIGIIESGIELIAQCLSPNKDNRPLFDTLLQHTLWSRI